jgi:hypothetical protein
MSFCLFSKVVGQPSRVNKAEWTELQNVIGRTACKISVGGVALPLLLNQMVLLNPYVKNVWMGLMRGKESDMHSGISINYVYTVVGSVSPIPSSVLDVRKPMTNNLRAGCIGVNVSLAAV